MVAESFTAIKEELILLVVRTVLAVDIDTLLYSCKAILQRRTGEVAAQSRSLIPFFKHIRRGLKGCHPIDHCATPQGASRQNNQTQVFRGQRPSLQVEFWRCPRLLQGKVCLVVIAALLQDNDVFPCHGEFTGDYSTTSARANHDHISLQRGIFGDRQWFNRLRRISRRRCRRGIVKHLPIWVDALLVGYREIDKASEPLHRLIALPQLRKWAVRHRQQILLALFLRERDKR